LFKKINIYPHSSLINHITYTISWSSFIKHIISWAKYYYYYYYYYWKCTLSCNSYLYRYRYK